MFGSTNTRAGLVTGLLLSLTMFGAAGPAGSTAQLSQSSNTEISTPLIESNITEAGTPASPDPLASTSVYYAVREDLRRCASPLCGGYWVSRVNLPRTLCIDGRWAKECYVAEIAWEDQPEIDPSRRALLRGTIVPRPAQGADRRRRLGVFRVTESWMSASNRTPVGTFYRATDRNVRCITYPCQTHHAAKLNSTESRDIAGVDLSGIGAPNDLVSEASTAMTTADAIIVAGYWIRVSGPGGKADALKATQFYTRARASIGRKPCMRTGCSNQVCADEPMNTTCEWRPEYACYARARCERQQDGQCGFTKTPELTACLARR